MYGFLIRFIWFTVGLGALARVLTTTLVAETEGITVRALTSEDGSTPVSTWLLGVTITLIVGYAFFSALLPSSAGSLFKRPLMKEKGLKVEKLFLAFDFKTRDKAQAHLGYLTAIDDHEAVFSTQQPVLKGDSISLHVGALPSYPNRSVFIPAKVVGSRFENHNEGWYTIKAQFVPNVAADLRSFLHGLADHRS